MTSGMKDKALPRKQLWMILMVPYFLQVGSWTLPKPQTRLKLPLDFPTLQPFYRVVVLPSTTDGPQLDFHVEFHVRKQKVHLQSGDGESRPYKRQLVEIDRSNGSVWLVRSPGDLDVYQTAMQAGKVEPRVFLSATVTAASGQNMSPKRMEIFLEFTQRSASYCEPSLTSCFPFSAGKYVFPEDSVDGLEFDFLQNFGFASMCPKMKVEYAVVSEYHLIEINNKTGALLLSKPPDAEELTSFNFNATCAIGKETFVTVGDVTIVDINDNPPTTQAGNSTATIIQYIKPGQTSLHFPVTAKDRDSKSENRLAVRIEEDGKNMFTVEDVKIYGGLGSGQDTFTFLQAEIKSKGVLSFPGREYNFTVVIEDAKLTQEENKVTYDIVLINTTDTELVLKELYEGNISRNAEQYARIIQLSGSSVGYTFRLSVGEKPYDFLAITRHTGIVYVKDPSLIPAPSTIRRNILWNGTRERTGSILLTLTIEDGIKKSCESSSKWCSYTSDENRCQNACGQGSRTGYCSWRKGSMTSTGPRPDFSTCSPDLNSCPDGHCDELETMEPSLCPQDCAKIFTGEVVPSKSGTGLQSAVGPCHCPSTDHCTCVRNYPPAEMRRPKPPDFRTSSSIPGRPHRTSTAPPPIIVEIYNESLENRGKLFLEARNLETSTPVEYVEIPGVLIESSCGFGCIVFATVLPVGLVLLLVVVVVTWRIRSECFGNPKFVSSHISLSGVPSDYVEDSAPDSRNTPSETSSFGKSSLADAKWEFPRNRLQLQSVLGEGEFGKVMEAQAWNIGGQKGYTTVAVKMLKENGGAQEKQDLMMEFMLLKEISHPNVVRLLGASTEKSGPFYLIVEFAEMGSLRSYLRRRRRHNCCRYNQSYELPERANYIGRDYYQHPCERSRHEPGHIYFHKEQLSFAWQIAKGMAYLSDMKLVHRDLAARNILLAKRKVVKISDFGLSRDIYEGDAYLKKSRGRVPVKWMAIESLEDQIYTSRSDVWSFGVVLWEIMMQGATPYPGVTPQRLYNLLKAGYRMSKPDNCSDEVYYLMRQCWRVLPRERPSFKELVLKLDFFLQDTVEYMDFVSKERAQRVHSIRDISTPDDPAPTIQYTSVLVEDDDEEEADEASDQESNENIGLVRLFGQPQETTSKTRLVDVNREESPA